MKLGQQASFSEREQLCQAQPEPWLLPACEGIWLRLSFPPREVTFEHPHALAPGQPSAHRWSGAAVAVVVSVVFLTVAPPRG